MDIKITEVMDGYVMSEKVVDLFNDFLQDEDLEMIIARVGVTKVEITRNYTPRPITTIYERLD